MEYARRLDPQAEVGPQATLAVPRTNGLQLQDPTIFNNVTTPPGFGRLSRIPAMANDSSEGRRPMRTPEEDLLPLSRMVKEHIVRVYHAVGKNKTRAARVLEIDVKTLYNKLKRYGEQ